jgi:hypothetical protein
MWIWADVSSDKDTFYANFDYDKSTLSSHLLVGPERLKPNQGHFTLDARRYTAKRVTKYGCINFASDTRVIHQRLIDVFWSIVPETQAQLFPIAVESRDGMINDFFAVVPLNNVECVDKERSLITRWLIVDSFASSYKSLTLKKNCLANLELCSDAITGLVVISDKLKLALEATKELGLYFEKPENLQTIF